MIQEFQKYLYSVKGYSENTVVAYGKDLRAFAQYISSVKTGASWSTLTHSDIQNYVVYLHDAQKENTTIRRKVAAIRSLYDYFKTQGYISKNPARYVQSPKVSKKQPNDIDVSIITDAVTSTAVDLKTRCMIALMAETGIRLQEMLDLNTWDFNGREQSIHITGKGKKDRTVYYGAMSKQLLNAYVGHRQGQLFTDSQREVRRAVYATLTRFGQARQMSPHAIRHTFATAMLRNGADIKSIQALLGHESVKTTEIYAQVAGRQVATQYELYAPTFN